MIKRPNMQFWLFALIVTVPFCQLTIANTSSCWTNDSECLIRGTLHKNLSSSSTDILPLDIDCLTTQDNSSASSVPDYLLKRFERAYRLTLNGCHKGLKWKTFGYEFMPNCDKIIELTVQKFNAGTLYNLQCPYATFIQLEILRFENNEVATVNNASFHNLSLLRQIYFISNRLRHVEGNSFDNLHFIERIHFENEPLLGLKDATAFLQTNVADIRLIGLKYVTSSLFENLPETLQNLTVSKTMIARSTAESIESNDVEFVNVNNPRLLRNISIIDCDLSAFKLNDKYGSVLFLNLSGNNLKDFKLSMENENSTSELKLLDLSHNKLQDLPFELRSIDRFLRLEKLNLQGNMIKEISLLTILNSFPAIKYIDLAANKLEKLLETNLQFEDPALYEVRIIIDNNPWNCKWLLEFAHTHPDKFRIFQYDKFLSQINVNGLACLPENVSSIAPPSPYLVERTKSSKKSGFNSKEEYLNISTFTLIYGSPWDIKRNQRSEALIIVFMLPVGIAILFLLLYMWIYCQKVFHLSFYQKCKFFKRRRAHPPPTSNHFDIVRQLPPNATVVNNNEGYEQPLNVAFPSICNCTHTTGNSGSVGDCSDLRHNKCHKTHHITYVPLPDEHAQQIYEEIIDSGDKNNPNDAVNHSINTSKHPVYDHLTFE